VTVQQVGDIICNIEWFTCAFWQTVWIS